MKDNEWKFNVESKSVLDAYKVHSLSLVKVAILGMLPENMDTAEVDE